MRRFALIPILALSLARCSSSSSTDAAPEDTGGGNDAASDSGARDTGGGTQDTGGTPDAGTPDSGPKDTGPTNPCDGVQGTCVAFTAGMSTEDQIANAFVRANPHTTLAFGPGTFEFTNTLSLAVSNITVKGAGMDQTTLDFKNQAGGSEGIYASDVTNLKFQDFGIVDTKGNGIKVLTATSATFLRVHVAWTSTNAKSHGAYGVYPVQSFQVLIDGCTVSGANDTGLYIGQSKSIIVRNSTVTMNVAGIEIENSYDADVYSNVSAHNAGGILVFDLPDLPQKGGHGIRVFNNKILNNNTLNFAPAGDIVAVVPAGTGSFVMANHDVEVFNNHIEGNETVGLAAISFFITQIPIRDMNYYPWPARVHFHDNTLVNNAAAPDLTNPLGQLLMSGKSAFTNMKYPDLVYDGFVDPSIPGHGNTMQICFENNGDATFSNLHLDRLNAMGTNLAMILTQDLVNYTCSLPALPPVSFPGSN